MNTMSGGGSAGEELLGLAGGGTGGGDISSSSNAAADSVPCAAASAEAAAAPEALSEMEAQSREDSQEVLEKTPQISSGKSRKRKYPPVDFSIDRVAGSTRSSYHAAKKILAVEYSRRICEDGKPVGNAGTAKMLNVDKKRIIEWVQKEGEIAAGLLQAPPAAEKPKLPLKKQQAAGKKRQRRKKSGPKVRSASLARAKRGVPSSCFCFLLSL